MTYEECLQYLYEKLPMFQRQGAPAFKKDLTNTLKLLEHAGNPHLTFKSIHIAGTNGKGSSAHALASILQSAGFKTGLYTSPHLKSFTERIRLNGKEIPKQTVIRFVEQFRSAIEEIKPSFFEVTVVMSFWYFQAQEVDIAVIETGLGGRLDSTNVITPEVSLITQIGYDHMEFLGETLPEIAGEKAGIIKPGVPVVMGVFQPKVHSVFEKKAQETGSELINQSEDYRIKSLGMERLIRRLSISSHELNFETETDILADYFLKNLPGVLSVVSLLRTQGWAISDQAVSSGLSQIKEKTGLKGRFQVINESPLIVADVSHNEQGISELLRQINNLKCNQLHVIYGVVKDKKVDEILKLFPEDTRFYFTQADVPRAMDHLKLKELAEIQGISGPSFPNVNEALKKVKTEVQKNEVILITGSTFVVSEIEEL